MHTTWVAKETILLSKRRWAPFTHDSNESNKCNGISLSLYILYVVDGFILGHVQRISKVSPVSCQKVRDRGACSRSTCTVEEKLCGVASSEKL